jgi:hypothetical protein
MTQYDQVSPVSPDGEMDLVLYDGVRLAWIGSDYQNTVGISNLLNRIG